jgi:cell filamentation protein
MPGYTLPDEMTLKNRIGASRAGDLLVREGAFVSARYLELAAGPVLSDAFDAAHLKAIHRHLFQDVFEWAGRTRDERVQLSDGAVATEPVMGKPGGRPFLAGPSIAAALYEIAANLRDADHLRGLSRAKFAGRAADVMIELNAVRPFREGNGRTQRVFMEQLARAAGHDLDFTVVSKARMIRASVAAHESGDASMMRRLFDEISDRPRASLLREGLADLDRLRFSWNDRYVATLTPRWTVELVFVGAAEDQFMARGQADILFGQASDLPEPRPERGAAFWVKASPYKRRAKSARGK